MDDIPQPSDNLPDLQHGMQRKLGRCLLQLQQYEKLLKAMVAHSSLSGPLDQLPTIRERMIQAVRQKTMGTLMGMLTESYMTSPTSGVKPPPAEIDPGNEIWVSYQHELKISSEQYESTKSALKELVALRNDLVHHFIDRFDLWSTEGCAAADQFLEDRYKTIHHHYLNLRSWAQAMNETHTAMVQWLQSPEAESMLWDDLVPASFDRADGEI